MKPLTKNNFPRWKKKLYCEMLPFKWAMLSFFFGNVVQATRTPEVSGVRWTPAGSGVRDLRDCVRVQWGPQRGLGSKNSWTPSGFSENPRGVWRKSQGPHRGPVRTPWDLWGPKDSKAHGFGKSAKFQVFHQLFLLLVCRRAVWNIFFTKLKP